MKMFSYKLKLIFYYNRHINFSALLAVVAASLFAAQIDDERNGYEITRGPGFYIEVSYFSIYTKKKTVNQY